MKINKNDTFIMEEKGFTEKHFLGYLVIQGPRKKLIRLNIY
jgi:hypothetical protein